MFTKVTKSGEFKPNKKDENENIQYYAGSENQLAMTRSAMSRMLVMNNGDWKKRLKSENTKNNGLTRFTSSSLISRLYNQLKFEIFFV